MNFSFIIFGVILWTISFGIHVTSGQIPSLSRQTTHLQKCCGFDEEYLIGFDECGAKKEDVVPQELNPPIDNTVLSSSSSPNIFKRFNTTYNRKIPCQNGYVANISLDFQLLPENGSLLILPNRISIPENEFCIDQQYRTFTNSENPAALVARYCAPDPCIGRHCVRKCCPFGMVLHEATKLCQPATENLGSFQIRDESGVAILQSAAGTKNLAIRDAASPVCPDDSLINFVSDYGVCFSILQNGTLFVPLLDVGEQYSNIGWAWEQYSDQYCVEHELTADGHHNIMAIFCLRILQSEMMEDSWVFRLYPYLLYVSSTFLIATFVVYAIIPELRNNVHGISIMCHVASLAVMYIGLGAIQSNLDISNEACYCLAIVTHFAFLSSFTWLTVMSFDIWWTFSGLRPKSVRPADKKKRIGRRLKFYFIYAWTVPLIIALTGILTDNLTIEQLPNKKCWFDSEEERLSYLSSLPIKIIRPHFGEGKCWFPYNVPAIAYLYGPIGFSIFTNILFFALTSISMYRTSSTTTLAAGKTKAKKKFRVIFSIFILMGLTWIFQVISYAIMGLSEYLHNRREIIEKAYEIHLSPGQSLIWITIDLISFVINGILIFIMFVCKPTVWKRLQLKFPILKRLNGLICCPFSSTCIKKKSAQLTPSQNEMTIPPIQLQSSEMIMRDGVGSTT